MSSKPRVRAKPRGGYRSSGEHETAQNLKRRKIKFTYEPFKIPFVLERTYEPDFQLENGILIEYKGVLTPDDRRKLRAVRDQHPDIDLRIVFQRASNRLNKGSSTTYGKWADNNGFVWADGVIPTSWSRE